MNLLFFGANEYIEIEIVFIHYTRCIVLLDFNTFCIGSLSNSTFAVFT